MKQSIIAELTAHAQDLVNGGAIDQNNIDDAHHIAFNFDYYIIGYYQADEWLKKHNVSPWQAISYVIEQEQDHFGESHLNASEINSENIVNQLVYFAGYQIDFEELLPEAVEA